MAVTIHKIDNHFNEVTEYELKGLSTDDKPVQIEGFPVGVNSLFLELDTGYFYYFDGSTWVLIGSGE